MLEPDQHLQRNTKGKRLNLCVEELASIQRSQGKAKVSRRKNCSGIVIRISSLFHSFQELAKRFALSFGLDAIKNREAIISLHRAGILFAVQSNSDAVDDPSAPPPCLLFLEILNEFTNKLLKQDKKVV